MNAAVAEAYELEGKLALARSRRGLLAFTLATKSDFEVSWHHRAIARAVNALERQDSVRTLLRYYGYTDATIEKKASVAHPVTGLYFGMTDPTILDKPLSGLQVMVHPRAGKLLADETLVKTPTGCVYHGDLAVGDLVFGRDGRPTRIIAVSAPGYADRMVTFTNGQTILCHEEHLWMVAKRGRGQASYRVQDTKMIERAGPWCGPLGKRGGVARYALPPIGALVYPEKDLIVPPYILGAWLGDGSAASTRITHAASDTQIVQEFERLGYPRTAFYVHKTTGVIASDFTTTGVPNRVGRLGQQLRAIGVHKNKHIPPCYMRSSVKQRKELLSGLIDTDGYIGKNGRVHFTGVDQRLCADVAELVRSLGCRVSISQEQPKTSTSGIIGRRVLHKISFSPSFRIDCRIARKQVGASPMQRRIGIAAIDVVTPKPGKCIQVEACDGIYLVGEKLIPTHNSEIISRRTPAWWLGRNPDDQIVACSYGAELAARNNRDVQRCIDEELSYANIFPETKLFGSNVRSVAKGSWLRNSDIFEVVGRRGCYKNSGVGGPLTGLGANLALVDDLTKNRAEAESAVIRERNWDWYTSTLYTRLEKKARKITIGTRWHQADISGKLLDQAKGNPEADQWFCLVFPAILDCEPGPADPRTSGEALWPDKYDARRLASIRASVGAYEWEALYQQRPSPRGGGIIKDAWWRYYEALPKNISRWTMSVDLSFEARGDYSAFTVWAQSGAEHYLVDLAHARVEFSEQVLMFERLCRKWPQMRAKLVESAANGAALISTLKRRIPGIIGIRPEGSKQLRVDAVAPMIEAGNVHLPHPSACPWVDKLVQEFAAFPTGAHDDICDSTSMYLSWADKKPDYLKGVTPGSITRQSPWLGGSGRV